MIWTTSKCIMPSFPTSKYREGGYGRRLHEVRKQLTKSLCFPSDIIIIDQNWHHLYSSSAEGKVLSSDTMIREISSVEPEISTKMFRNLSEKLRAKLPATSCAYSRVKCGCLDDAFSEVFELEVSPVEGNHCSQKIRKEEKGKA